jgi:hypothetical protein
MAGEAAPGHATRSIDVIGADVEGDVGTVVPAVDDPMGAPSAVDTSGSAT